MEHVDTAIKNEGKILTPADKELLPLLDRQRAEVLDGYTVKEARETAERLSREMKRLDAMRDGLRNTRAHLTRIIGTNTEDF